MPDKNLEQIAELEKMIADLKEENRIYSGPVGMTDMAYYNDLISRNEAKISELEAKLEQLKKTVKSDEDDEKKAEIDKVRKELLELKDKLYNYRMSVYKLEEDYDLVAEEKMISAISDYVRSYKGILTPEELKNIDSEYDVDRRVKSELGEELAEFAEKYLVLYTKVLKDLQSADYGTEEYDRARTRFEKFLEAAKKLDGKHNISVSFDEKEQRFTMDFDGKLPTISNQVVNNGTKDRIEKADKKDEPENIADKFESDFRGLVDDEISRLSGHFMGTDKLTDTELVDVFHQAPKREDYDGLNEIEAENIETMMRGYRFGKLTGAFNDDLAFIIDHYLEILSIKEELSKVEYGTSEFEELLLNLREVIKQIQLYNDDEISVEFDEDNYLLTVAIKDGKMGELVVPEKFIEAQIVSDKTLGEMRKASKKGGSLPNIERRLFDALTKPSIKYMIWLEKFLVTHTPVDEEALKAEKQKIMDILNDELFASIPEERREKIRAEVLAEREEDLIKKYGEELYNLLFVLSDDYKESVDRLKAATYGTKEFEEALKDVQKLIERARKVDGVTVNYNEDLQRLSISFGDPNIDDIMDEIVSKEALEAMKKAKSDGKDDGKSEPEAEQRFREDFKAELQKLVAYNERVLKTHTKDVEEEKRLIKELDAFKNAYKGLSSERKEEIKNELLDEIKLELEAKYGKELYGLLKYFVEQYKKVVSELQAAKYGTPEFDRAKLVFEMMLDRIESTPGVTAQFNEDNQNLSIRFDNPDIEPIFATVVSKETLEAMKKAKDSGKPDPKPDPGKDDKDKKPDKPDKNVQADIDEYIARVAEINNMVAELERMNIIEDSSIDPLSPSYMDRVIENEKIAREYESLINKNRLELSKFRMDFTKKYGKYIFSYPEVKSTEIKEPTYKDTLEEFTKKVDEIVIRAEYERTRDNIDEADIAKLNEFIDAQNAMVSRRLISRVASDISYNSKDYLDTRRKDKQAQRKEILQKEKGSEFIENYTIKGSTLNFNPAVKEKIDTSKAVVISATDQINVELYKSRIVIKMTKQVKDRLAKLKTAIKLTNKHGSDQIIDVNRNKSIEFGANGEDLTGLGLEVVSRDPSISDEAMYSMDLEELKSRSK